MIIDEHVKEISDFLISTSAEEADFHPIDRAFLEPFIGQIVNLDRKAFIVYNFEYNNILYSSTLFLCLPELWQNMTADDLINIVKEFTTDYQYLCFVYFTYKFIEIDSIKLLLELPFLKTESKHEIKNYIKRQYNNFVKEETDYLFFDQGIFGCGTEVWKKIKQNFLTGGRIQSALATVEQLRYYVMEL